ncbi:PAS-domain containing protein [Shimia sp.]|uniref:PAS-domain containing protein n=1 Tax=Shimia sp. TaxID=1954381 RepID=UPI003BAB0D69
MLLTSTQLLFVLAASVLFVTCVWMMTRRLPQNTRPPTEIAPNATKACFLFRSGSLIDANPAALQICAETPVETFDWSALHQKMAPLFPDFPRIQGASQDRDVTILRSQDPEDGSIVTIDQWDEVARITIAQDDAPDAARRTAIMQAMFQAPNPIWKSDTEGNVVWRNGSYKNLVGQLGHQSRNEPVFDVRELIVGEPSKRLQVTDKIGATTRWFDVTAVQAGNNVMYYATEADAVVSALDAQRSFVQIFSKTFAHLSTGLAIFDRDRRLILFNPALMALTGLSAEFLSKRCDAKSFFDQLREMHVAPNVSTNKSWAEQVEIIMQAALEDRYSKTWTLPSGVTYRVTGRPHPDGALVFLVEDITAEITVTRRFRAELDQCHGVMDTIKSALVLFSSTGQLQLCNEAYRRLWKSDPDSSFAKYTLTDALAHWRSDCLPNEIWPQLQNRILSTSIREHWHATITLKTLTAVRLTLTPIAGGMTLVSFDKILPFGTPDPIRVETQEETPIHG